MIAQIKFGDSIRIRYTVGRVPVDGAFVRYGWHKVVRNNRTIKVIGGIYDSLSSVKGFKELKYRYLDESKENQSTDAVNGWTSALDHLQFIIRDDDTINYYDTLGRMQGRFFFRSFFPNSGGYQYTNERFMTMCKNCVALYTYCRYRNDSMLERLVYGVSDNYLIDTVKHELYTKDSLYLRNKINLDFYTKQKTKIIKQGEVSANYPDTIKTYYNSGELFSTVVSGGFGLIIGQSKVYWKNGNLKFIWNFKNGKKDGENFEYYENGGLRYKFIYENGKLVSQVEVKKE